MDSLIGQLLPSLLLLVATPLLAAEAPGAAQDEPAEAAEADVSGSIDDADGSIIFRTIEKVGWSFNGDLRGGYSYSDLDQRDGTNEDGDKLSARFRIGTGWGLTEKVRFGARLAGTCTTDHCDPDFIMQPELPTPTSIEDGQITFDELFFQWYRSDRFDVALGRMQTKFVAHGGVFAKSLDRNNSNNVRVNWVDGFHGTIRVKDGWDSHLILQYNSSDGAGSIYRSPLDFTDDDSRVTYFLAFENLEPQKNILQRGIDVSYLPKSLLKDGMPTGRVEDYWGFVARAAGRWPARAEGPRLRLSTELGYAPETQTNAAAGLAGTGDVDGWAWNFAVSVMDFLPKNSIGINYGHTDPGWLLSPQYRENEQLFELRYMLRWSQTLAIDVRVRFRKELEKQVTAAQRREEFDFFIRFTWGFTI